MQILEQLKKEHQEIKKLLDLLDFKSKNFLSILEQLDTLVEKHHQREEQVLFPAAVKNVPMEQGGPRCTYFMGIRIEDDITKRILLFLKKHDFSFTLQTSSTLCDELIKKNHPLSIPLGEHIAGHALMNFMKSNPASKDLEIAVKLYNELMLLHIEKEDTCLFEMLKRTLPSID